MKRILLPFLLFFVASNLFSQAPANYYNGTAGLTGAALKTKLSQIITTGHIDKSYDNLWNAYLTTDRDKTYENDNTILDIYSENPTGSDPYNFNAGSDECGNYSNEGDCYNREHIVPQSLFNEARPMKTDVHFVRATDGKVNGYRSNYPFGIVSTTTYTSQNGSKLGSSGSNGYNGTVFEPINEFKGDVARMIFYFVTRYENKLSTFASGGMLGSSAFPGLQQWQLNQLLAWHAQDPVSQAEILRNNASYTYQGNRNPYIDNPAYVDLVWGTQTVDTQSPSAPTNLIANNPTSTTISLSWNASTDNIGVTAYDIYANGVFKTTVTTNSTTVQGLTPSTTYTFYIIARDAAQNSSTQSNTATETTLAGSGGGGTTTCGTEDFSNIPSSSASSYSTRIWTNNNITWTATDARTDQTITGKAITLRNGTLSSNTISGGISSITFYSKLIYGNPSSANVLINDVLVGTINYKNTVSKHTFPVNNVTGNFVIKIVNTTTDGDRFAIDDLSWTCGTLSTREITKENTFAIYPNPVKNNELFVKGTNLNAIKKAEIFDLNGKLIKTISQPFKNGNKIDLQEIEKGMYILKTDNNSTKFIVD